MDSIERFLQTKILGVDMIGIIFVSVIVVIGYVRYQGHKRGTWSAWKIPIGCLVVGAIGLLMALVMFERQTKAAEVLKTWTKADGVVTRMEQLENRGRRGRITYTKRATVSFVGSDGKRKEGLLFHEQHAEGSHVGIFYDPQKDYSPGAPVYNGARELHTPQSAARGTDSEVRVIGIASLLIGIGCCGFGSYRLFNLIGARRPNRRSAELVEA